MMPLWNDFLRNSIAEATAIGTSAEQAKAAATAALGAFLLSSPGFQKEAAAARSSKQASKQARERKQAGKHACTGHGLLKAWHKPCSSSRYYALA